jgi:hypothetical protein
VVSADRPISVAGVLRLTMPSPPYVLVDRDGWVSIVESSDALVHEVEPIDVAEREVRIFDSQGRTVELRLLPRSGHRLLRGLRSERLEIVPESGPSQPRELAQLLTSALRGAGIAIDHDMPLERLVHLAMSRGFRQSIGRSQR